MTVLVENKKQRVSYGGVWPTKERHQVRHYECAGAPEYQVVLNKMYINNKKWLYSCTIERNIGDVIESFTLHIGGSNYWGGNRPWEFAEGQIGYYIAQYLKEKEGERPCPIENQQTKS
jgi:hypothetical protein